MNKPEDNAPGHDGTTPLRRADSSMEEARSSSDAGRDRTDAALGSIFPTGTVLESRFRIVRVLGRGGMGEVYEAEDFVLKENIAVKTMLPHIAANERFRERFRREVLLARKVAHPNVCRIFEVYSDTPSSPGGGLSAAIPPFITMELLHGQTLAEFLQEKSGAATDVLGESNKRRLTFQEGLPLISQMLEALRAAHHVDVIHRDFKCSNVFLAVRAGTTQTRLVVTDFGLARLAESDGPGIHSFTSESMVGSPVYMAPEQVEGGEITKATDIYALGVVMYEMATGAWPFVGRTPNETASLRLKTNPKPPREFVPSIEASWNAVILKCLERAPADRFRTAEEVLEALTGETKALRRRTQEQRQNLRKRLLTLGVAALILAVAAAAYRWWPRGRIVPEGQAVSIAVVRFHNLTQNADKDWIGASLQDVLTRELDASDGFRVKAAADVARMQKELEIPRAGDLDQPTLERIRNNLSVDRLILGDYEPSGPANDAQIRVTLRVFDSARGAEPATIPESGRENDIFSLSDRIARDVRVLYKVGELSAAARAEVRASLPSTAASQAYFAGMQKLDEFDPQSARDFFQEAVKANPDAPLAHLELSESWDMLGYDEKALTEATLAQQAARGLSQPEQRAIECRVLELQRKDWDEAIARCQGLWAFRKRLADGLRLAEVQFSAERGTDALNTLDVLRKLPAPDNSDPRIDLQEAEIQGTLGRFDKMKTAADAARQKAEARNARLLQAKALLWRCVAQENLDVLDEAVKDCGDSDGLYMTVGDKIGRARAKTNLAHALTKKKDERGAAKGYADALELAGSVGSIRDECDALLNYGDDFYDQKKLPAAADKYEKSLTLAEKSGYRVGQAHANENLGLIATDQHNFAEASKRLDKAQQFYSDLKMDADLARLQSNQGDFLWQKGDPAKALERLQDAANLRRNLKLRDGLVLTLMDLGDVLLANDKVDKALDAYNEAISVKKEIHEDKDVPNMQIYVAQALVEKGDFAGAEASARKLVDLFSAPEGKDPDNEVFARDVLLRALLPQPNRGNDVATETKSLNGSLAKAKDTPIILTARTTLGRAYAAQRLFSQAQKELEDVLREAEKSSFVLQAYDAKLALFQAAKAKGPLSKADRQAINDFAKETYDKGYCLASKKASALLGD